MYFHNFPQLSIHWHWKRESSNNCFSKTSPFSWTGSYLVEPEDLPSDQTYRDIPVIEGDQEVVQCKVRVLQGDPQHYKINWDGRNHFNASTSGERRIETSEDGIIKYYAVENITVNIVDAAAIDEKSIWCEYGEGLNLPANTELLFKAFVPGGSDFPQALCESCNGEEYFQLSKATNRKTDSLSFQMKEMIREKVMNKYGATDVKIDSDGSVCGCRRNNDCYQSQSQSPEEALRCSPPLLNVIRESKVLVTPEEMTCGLEGPGEFCVQSGECHICDSTQPDKVTI